VINWNVVLFAGGYSPQFLGDVVQIRWAILQILAIHLVIGILEFDVSHTLGDSVVTDPFTHIMDEHLFPPHYTHRC